MNDTLHLNYFNKLHKRFDWNKGSIHNPHMNKIREIAQRTGWDELYGMNPYTLQLSSSKHNGKCSVTLLPKDRFNIIDDHGISTHCYYIEEVESTLRQLHNFNLKNC